MNNIKKVVSHIFIDGLSGMALGLFATLIIGTIMGQIGNLVGGEAGTYIVSVANLAKTLTGAGIGVGVAAKYKSSPLVIISAATAGMIGAFPAVTGMTEITLGKPGEPLGAFVAAFAAIELGSLISGRTKLDIILTPTVSIAFGSVVGFVIGPPISRFMTWLGNLVNVNVDAHPFVGGVIVSVLMGIFLTLPISSAAIGISMGITGLAAGAATIGCCCQMVGFAVASYRENGFGGLISQGVGTSMIQMPNIVRRPQIWLPSIISSALLAPLSTMVLKMISSPVGSGMGSSGLVGQIAEFQTMTAAGMKPAIVLVEIVVMHFLLPGALVLGIAEVMRKAGFIKNGDMKLTNN